jgi:hypothetical protein
VLQKIDTEHCAVCDPSNSNTNFTKDVNNETLTLKTEPREEFYIEVVKNIFTPGYYYYYYYCIYGILFVSILITTLRFEVLPTTEISVISNHVSLAIETPTQIPLNLIMKMYLIAT